MAKVSFDFCGNRYIVTGATSGIGKEIALSLAKNGAMVMCVGRNTDELEKLKSTSENIVPVCVDITDYDATNEAINSFVKEYGKLDGLVNCAGQSSLIALRSLKIDAAESLIKLNFLAAMNITANVLKRRNCNDGASVVLISSVAAHRGVRGEFAYGASKAALVVAVRCLSKEIAIHGNRINTISPGWINNTNMTNKAKEGFTEETFENMCMRYPLGLGNVKDVADMALYLLSDSARWITGADFVVDGGCLA